MKEESTPYVGADSLKQIRVLSTFQFTRFQLTELFACSCPQDSLASTLATSSKDFHLPCHQLSANITKIRITPNLCHENLVGFLYNNILTC